MTLGYKIEITAATAEEVAKGAQALAAQFGGEVTGTTIIGQPEKVGPASSTPAVFTPKSRKAKKAAEPEPREEDLPPVIKVADLPAQTDIEAAIAGKADVEIDEDNIFSDDKPEDEAPATDGPPTDAQRKEARDALYKICDAPGSDDVARGVLIGEFGCEKVSDLKSGQITPFVDRCRERLAELRAAAKAAKKTKG